MGGTVPCPVVLLLLMLALCCATASLQTPDTLTTATAVDPPFGLVMESYNFNTTLYWDYNRTSVTPRFTVQLRCYMSGKTFPVESCRNIAEHFCDLSHHAKDLDDFYWGQVKAIVGDQESDFAESASFDLPEKGKIGPPRLDVSIHQEEVVIEIFHPATYFKNRTLLDFYEDFTYIVFLGNKKLEFEDDECDFEACSMYVPLPERGVVFCVSAEGVSKSWAVSSEKSKEACLTIPDNESVKVHRYNLTMIVCFSFFAIGLLVLGLVFVYKILQRKNIKLPKSLAILALKRGATFSGEDATPEDVSPVSVMNERAQLLDQQPKSEIMDESPVQVVADHSQPSMENCSMPIPDGIEEIPDAYAAPNSSSSNIGKENYLTSDPCATEAGSVASSSDLMHALAVRTESIPPPAAVRESFGYDKPHAPLSFLTPEGVSAEHPETVS